MMRKWAGIFLTDGRQIGSYGQAIRTPDENPRSEVEVEDSEDD